MLCGYKTLQRIFFTNVSRSACAERFTLVAERAKLGSRAFQAERLLSVKGSAAELGTFGDERESLGTCGA